MARIVRWLSVVVMVCGRGHCQDPFVSTDTGPSDAEGATVTKEFRDKLSDAQFSLRVGRRRLWWPRSQANHSITAGDEGVSGEDAIPVTLSRDPRVNDGPLQLVDGGASSASFRGNHGSTTSRMGATSTKLDPSCLRYLSCHSDIRNIDFQQLEIHFWDLPERSAEACAGQCLALRPSTQLVLAKMIAMNERLVCGCGDPETIAGQGGVLNDSQFCSPCPDGEHKCGGVVSVSVYSIARACRPTPTPATGVDTTAATERLVPHGLSYSGCFREEGVVPSTTVAYLRSPKRSVVACANYCRKQTEDRDLVVLVSYRKTQDRLICSCGRSDMSLASASRLEDSRCQTVCPDGGDVCGGPDAVSVYSSGPMVKFSPLSLLLLLLLLTPSADGADAFHLFD
ncbi:uncharacterized protein [Panulirus ornatus]|uniref:uncharacterized protein n=1 Tax=Panulirus ornatus TaxID=150431 RepID=UPI003A862415